MCTVPDISAHTRTNDMSRLSDWGGLSSRACITSPPSSWYTRPYWINWESFGMSRRIVWTVTSKQVASDAVSFIHRERLIDSADRFGGVRTYSGSETNVTLWICWKTEDVHKGSVKFRSWDAGGWRHSFSSKLYRRVMWVNCARDVTYLLMLE